MKLPSRLIIVTTVAWLLVASGFLSAITAAAELGKQVTMSSIVAGAKKEGSLRALLGFDIPTIKALRDGFRKKYPFINPHFEEHGNPTESQRFLLELKTGRVSDWDISNVLSEAQHEFVPYLEKIDLRAMAEFGVLQIPPKMISPESRNIIALSSTVDASAYNKKLLPPDLVPKTWEDFLKPEHSGRKMLADIRTNSIAGLVPAMGLEWVESFARKVAAQQPIWVRGHTRYLVAMAAGEYRLFFGTYYHGVMRMKKKGAQDLEALIVEPVPVRLTETHAIVKGARRPAAPAARRPAPGHHRVLRPDHARPGGGAQGNYTTPVTPDPVRRPGRAAQHVRRTAGPGRYRRPRSIDHGARDRPARPGGEGPG